MVLTQGHDKSVDYWAYGILLYEILCGHTPFESSNQQRTFEKIVHSNKHLGFPNNFDPHAKSLIRRLLHPNGALRIGALQNGVNEIKSHAFFKMQGLNWENLENQEIVMPYIPNIDQQQVLCAQANQSITLLNLDEEMAMDLDDTYEEYFQDLNDEDI